MQEPSNKYRWGIEVTTEYLDPDGAVTHEFVDIRYAHSEEEARARYEVLALILADPDYKNPAYHRFAAARLVRWPVGVRETVDTAVRA